MDASAEPMMLSRKLGNLERAFWLKDQHMPYHFAVCAEIEGPTTIMDWRAALEAVQRRHPSGISRDLPATASRRCRRRRRWRA
jgi:hypothetical protein